MTLCLAWLCVYENIKKKKKKKYMKERKKKRKKETQTGLPQIAEADRQRAEQPGGANTPAVADGNEHFIELVAFPRPRRILHSALRHE
ncbi:hypothetical protein PUN28_014233 [Cardiocondyla obscurior]|uniref:Uncharacterized protein n=1 Tax=Cardiocondyla obscurior TaxID=286306 RepID=A0AAW2F1K8_9HYME